MIAYEKWKLLKEEIERVVEVGKSRGFDEGNETFENGCFFAYDFVLKLMNVYDNDSMEDYHND